LDSVEGGVSEEESALSNKASSLDSSSASRSISFSISFVRLSLSSALICASIVGCQFNFANQRRHGGKEDRNSDLLIDRDVDPQEINMAVRGEERDQDDKQAACEGGISGAIEQGKRIRLTRSKIHFMS
jgi:hypothetical protein